MTKFIRRILRRGYPVFNQGVGGGLNKIVSDFFGFELNDSGNKPYKIALILRDDHTYLTSSAFIRLVSPLTTGPLKALCSVRIYSENTTGVHKNTNICIVQRTAFDNKKAAEALVKNLRNNGILLIVDSDDAFAQIDPSHPEYRTHRARIEALNYLLSQADQIWVSTSKLADSYAPNLKVKLAVIPNRLDERLWIIGTVKQLKLADPSPIRMIYMGTATHDADFKLILPALDELHKDHPGSFTLTVIGVARDIGERPWLRRLNQPRGWSLYPMFVGWFLKQGPFDIGLAPLVDTEFNRGKSDIKCLDYLAAGILPMVSDVLPYQNPELDNYITRIKNNQKDWVHTLEAIIKDKAAFRQRKAAIIPKAQVYILRTRSSSNTALQMKQLLEELTGKPVGTA